MPYKGHKSITVKDDLYDELMQTWKERKPSYEKQGVMSFSAFVSRYLWEILEEDRKRAPKQKAPAE